MTKEVTIGKISIGGGNKIAVQSMTNTRTADIEKTAEQMRRLEKEGCDIIRVAVLDLSDAQAIKELKKHTSMPIVADIHFDHKLALAAMEYGADKIRINPGNIANEDFLRQIISKAKEKNVCIRIGVNGGSLNKLSEEKYGRGVDALVDSALRYVEFFEKEGFFNLVISIKSSSVLKTVEANRILSSKTNYPLHIGVTESGSGQIALTKSAVGIGSLLLDGIGDTIRVSLTDDPVEEVKFAKILLRAIEKDKNFCEVISCPSCGRCCFDLIGTAKQVSDYVKDISKPLKIAVMGCVVNGPGEAREADLGLAGGKGKVVFFKRGEVFSTVEEKDALQKFKEEIDKLR